MVLNIVYDLNSRARERDRRWGGRGGGGGGGRRQGIYFVRKVLNQSRVSRARLAAQTCTASAVRDTNDQRPWKDSTEEGKQAEISDLPASRQTLHSSGVSFT